jgi:hypothetical protein
MEDSVVGKLRLRDIEKTAALFGVSLTQAIGARRSYLWKEINWYLDCETDYITWRVICLPSIEAALKELYQLKKDLYYKSKPKADDEITPDMIARAKEFKITDLVEVDRAGKVCCLIHKEKTPSMAYNRQRNKLHCFGCGDNMDSIDVYMALNDANFHDAVRKLQG